MINRVTQALQKAGISEEANLTVRTKQTNLKTSNTWRESTFQVGLYADGKWLMWLNPKSVKELQVLGIY